MKKTPIYVLSSIVLLVAIFIVLASELNMKLSSADELIVMLVLFELGAIATLAVLIKKWRESKLETHTKVVKEDQVVCSVCGTINRNKKAYCYHCNSSLKVIVCPVCKEVNQHDSKYCKTCDSILQNSKRYI